MEKFSDSLQVFNGKIENPALQGSISYLKEKLKENFKLLEWSEDNIAVSIDIDVDLPSLGNYEDIDIKVVEPIIFVFNLNKYPYTAPTIFTDRLDFPKNQLAHLYVALPGRPPAFCYVRGNRDEWYANKCIKDLIIRISNWLRDAATGELTEDGEQFDPLRLENYSGTITYDYDLFAKIINKNESFIPSKNWTFGLFERATDTEVGSFHFKEIITPSNAKDIISKFDLEKSKDNTALDKKHYHYGYLLWNTSDQLFKNYKIELPNNWEEFKSFCELYDIDHTQFENLLSEDGNQYINFPVILGIKRPKNIIGFTSNIEFLNFKFSIDTSDVSGGKITSNFPIRTQAHSQPLTQSRAKAISGSISNFSTRSVVFGCGALGSKIIMHFCKSGHTAFTLIDPDLLSPHNLVRHALTQNDVGNNKAFSLHDTIKKMYPSENLELFNFGPSFKEGFFEKPDTFKKYEWIFDFTASESFFNKLTLANNMDESKIFSASISDFGNMGVGFREGKNRNPRLDDLQVELYSQYKNNEEIKNWLKREKDTNGNTVVYTGIGCGSETIILSDSKVSSHSAYFAGAIENEMRTNSHSGKIFLNHIKEGENFTIKTETINIDPFDIRISTNDNSWSIRYKKGILEQIAKETVQAQKNETGGVFIGMANYKTKTIHVIDLISAPPDSDANNICFYRGHSGLPEKIAYVNQNSGGQLGYIGEWHSHPDGPNTLSTVDMESIKKFKSEFEQLLTPLPVFITIVTPIGILPFVF